MCPFPLYSLWFWVWSYLSGQFIGDDVHELVITFFSRRGRRTKTHVLIGSASDQMISRSCRSDVEVFSLVETEEVSSLWVIFKVLSDEHRQVPEQSEVSLPGQNDRGLRTIYNYTQAPSSGD